MARALCFLCSADVINQSNASAAQPIEHLTWTDEQIVVPPSQVVPEMSPDSCPQSQCYSSLDASRQEIRLLEISPELDSYGRVVCQLETVSLKTPTLRYYEAVSWSWGDARHKTEILLNGTPIEIPANAGEVLEKVCVAKAHSCVWLDAVCINQEDVDERSQQVTLMEQIYSRADRVVVWLGEGSPKVTESALASISKLKNHFLRCTDHLAGPHDESNEESSHRPRYRILYLSDSPMPTYASRNLPDCEWQAIEQFYSVPWFSRLWVCQEVMLNTNVVCLSGPTECPWYDVGLTARWLVHCRYWRPQYMGKNIHNIATTSSVWGFTYTGDPDWENLLWLGRERAASVPVDHVYGILGLVPKTSASQIARTEPDLQPDYRKPLAIVFAAATRVAIKARQPFTNALNVLWVTHTCVPPVDHNPQKQAHVTDEEWPSWVPRYDWKVDVDMGSPVAMHDLHGDNAAGTYRATQMLEPPISPLILSLQGIIVSKVSALGRVLSKPLLADKQALSEEILVWSERARAAGFSESDFAMTLTTRKNHAEEDAARDDQFLKQYSAFLTQCRQAHTAKPWSEDAELFTKALWRGSANKVCIELANGQFGMCYPHTQPDDLVVILFCGMSPFILRPVAGQDRSAIGKDQEVGKGIQYRFIGHAYIHNIMHVSHSSFIFKEDISVEIYRDRITKWNVTGRIYRPMESESRT